MTLSHLVSLPHLLSLTRSPSLSSVSNILVFVILMFTISSSFMILILLMLPVFRLLIYFPVAYCLCQKDESPIRFPYKSDQHNFLTRSVPDLIY